jgi:hypothetical protein
MVARDGEYRARVIQNDSRISGCAGWFNARAQLAQKKKRLSADYANYAEQSAEGKRAVTHKDEGGGRRQFDAYTTSYVS